MHPKGETRTEEQVRKKVDKERGKETKKEVVSFNNVRNQLRYDSVLCSKKGLGKLLL